MDRPLGGGVSSHSAVPHRAADCDGVLEVRKSLKCLLLINMFHLNKGHADASFTHPLMNVRAFQSAWLCLFYASVLTRQHQAHQPHG